MYESLHGVVISGAVPISRSAYCENVDNDGHSSLDP